MQHYILFSLNSHVFDHTSHTEGSEITHLSKSKKEVYNAKSDKIAKIAMVVAKKKITHMLAHTQIPVG